MGVLDPVPDLSNVKPSTKTALGEEQAAAYLSSLFALMTKRIPMADGSGGTATTDVTDTLQELAVTPLEEDMDAGYIDGALTAEECACIRGLIDAADAPLSFWNASGRGNEEARRFRDADTIEIHSKAFGDLLWTRLDALLSERVVRVAEEESSELQGEWRPTTTNHDLLFAKYPPMGHFAPHTDGNAINDFNCRSMYSVIIFLNTIPMGGGTRFYENQAVHNLQQDSQGRWTCDTALATALVPAVEGRLLFFRQDLVHEGVPPEAPHSKYIIRSDIMMRRTPPLCDGPLDRVGKIRAHAQASAA